MTIYDISLPIHPGTPTWPSDSPPQIRRLKDLDKGDAVTLSRLELGAHAGTHLDAPAHFIQGGATVETLPLELLIGPCVVAQTAAAPLVTAADLDALSLPPETTRLLLKTGNSARWGDSQGFRSDFIALSPDAARWIVDRGIRLVGVDYLSVEQYNPPREHPVHHTLLAAGVIVVEGLNLADVPPGGYTLVCLPLRVIGVEGAPARAILLDNF